MRNCKDARLSRLFFDVRLTILTFDYPICTLRDILNDNIGNTPLGVIYMSVMENEDCKGRNALAPSQVRTVGEHI